MYLNVSDDELLMYTGSNIPSRFRNVHDTVRPHLCYGMFMHVMHALSQHMHKQSHAHEVTLAEADAGFVPANEVADGMHCLWFLLFERLSSRMASDPAEANESYSSRFICR